MFDWVTFLPFMIMVVIIGYLAFQVATLYKDKIDLIKELIQSNNDVDMLSSRLEEVASKQELLAGSENDFIKFLSQTREDAFEYIAKVQGGIAEFVSATDAKDDVRVLAAYQELISFLPSDNDMVE